MSKVNRSHPPSLRNIVMKTIETECDIPFSSKICLGVSGGPDSMALLQVLAGLQERMKFKLYAIGVDHGLRTESEHEVLKAMKFANELNVPFKCCRVKVLPGNVHDQARRARYEAIEAYADTVSAKLIATAHHADDLAETVLMRIIRGASANKLTCMSPHYGKVLRPMLRASKRDVDLHIERKSIPHCIDPSNKSRKYTRAKIRYDIMPALKELNPNLVEALCNLSKSSKNFNDT